MNNIDIKVKKLKENAKMPYHGSEFSAGYDLHACIEKESLTIPSHETVIVPTGLSIEIPEGYFAGIFARSGLATKQGLRPANCVGVIDSDYRGEYMVALHNDTDNDKTIINGGRIAQLVIIPFLPVNFIETDELTKTDRGDSGFGSSGK